jgi:1-deoxy-D-xylulose-5-phosphate reductoisomerase
MKRVALLGSTGSIGASTLGVIKRFPKLFRCEALAANTDIKTLARQIKLFRPSVVCVFDRGKSVELARTACGRTRVVSGPEGLNEICRHPGVDSVVAAISGSEALAPVCAAVESGKEICLANKECLVMAGDIIMRRAAAKGAAIRPIDSEQSAIWQCLLGEEGNPAARIWLTASGGPFWKRKGSLERVRLAETLRHPRWKMGRKITVDSATMMNKGLEVLEAMHLFGVAPSDIEVVIHPGSVVHSMVEFADGTVKAQLSQTDMRIPIQFALSFPRRLPSGLVPLDFFALKSLDFHRPDMRRFPCLGFAYQAARDGGTMPSVMNAANEAAVAAFLKGRLSFTGIPRVIENVMRRHRVIKRPGLKEIMAADRWSRDEADALMERAH